MSTTIYQNNPIVIGTPIEIDDAVNKIRLSLAELPWIDNPMFIAQRFIREINGRKFIYPETYAPETAGSRNYKRLTPDNDYKGLMFFYVGPGKQVEKDETFFKYPVSIIFSVNLELIDNAKLDQGLFTQELIRDVRRLLISSMPGFLFKSEIKAETRDLREVYREFVLDDLESYNRAPLQCFRFDLDVTVNNEDC